MQKAALLVVFSFILSCDEGLIEVAEVIYPDSATELELVDVDQDVEPDVQPEVQDDTTVEDTEDVQPVDVPEDVLADVELQQFEVNIGSDPTGASVSIDDQQDVCTTPCSQPLSEGTHVFLFTLEGYNLEMVEEDISETNTSVFVTLTETPPDHVEVSIDSDPQGATVSIDGVLDICNTPCSQPMMIGEHTFEFVLEGYEPASVTEVVDVENDSIFVTLTELPVPEVEVSIDSDPQGATVSIDGVLDICNTPCSQPMTLGEHTFDFVLEGYEPASVTEVVDVENDSIFVTLTELPVPEVEVSIDSDPQGAAVAIDGEADACTTPCAQSLTMEPHQFVFTLDGYESETVDEDISDTNNSVFATLTEMPPDNVEVSIGSDPQGATVSVDGVLDICDTPCIQSMLIGEHTFEFALDGYEPDSVTQVVDAANDSVFVTLTELPAPEVDVSIDSDPQSATVAIDGQADVCTTPCSQSLTVGFHEFVFALADYEVETVNEDISDTNNSVFATLTEMPPQVLVSINSDPQAATVMIDDVPDVCTTPCEQTMSVGMHDFVFTVEPYDPVSMLQVDISELNNAVFAVIDTVPTIEVTVIATPPNTTVTIDDNFVDTVPFVIDLKEGWHHFVYEKLGYITQEYDELISADNDYFFITLQTGK